MADLSIDFSGIKSTRGARAIVSIALLLALGIVPSIAQAAWPTDPTLNVPVCTHPASASVPVAVSDGRGGTIVVWLDYRNRPDKTIYVQHVLASGTVDPLWPVNGLQVARIGNVLSTPNIVPDGVGGSIVTWVVQVSQSDFDLYAHHVLSGGQLDPLWPAGGLAVSSGPSWQAYDSIVSDGSGGAFLAWFDSRDITNFEIYAQHVLMDGRFDPVWPAGGLNVSNSPTAEGAPRVVNDGAGGVIIAWSERPVDGNLSDIVAKRVIAGGTFDPAWPEMGRLLCGEPHRQVLANLVADGSGGAFALWGDRRNSSDDLYGPEQVYVQHLLADGEIAPGWPADGSSVGAVATHATSNNEAPALLPDTDGGVFVAWSELGATPTQSQARLQHLTSQGSIAPGSPSNGAVLREADGIQYAVGMVSDGEGGAIIAWSDGAGGGDLWAQHVLAGGDLDPVWNSDGQGRPVSTANGQQSDATMISDGEGGAILAFADIRTNEFLELYAQRILANGNLGGGPPSVPPGEPNTLSLAPRPNPASGGAFVVDFTLASESPASLELFDVAGRRLVKYDVGSLGPGPHAVALAAGLDLGAGVYVIRLEQSGTRRTSRVAVLQ